METIRIFEASDIPQVAALHARVFEPPPGAVAASDDRYARYLTDVFLTGPRRVPGIDSLVCERDGRVVGFLGVFVVALRFGPHTRLASVCSQFSVDPAHRGLTGLKLIQRHFAGPQDISMTDEANETTRQLWTWAGGETVIPSSLYWTRPLRLAQFGLSFLKERRPWALIARAGAPAAALGDRLLGTLPHPYFRRRSSARGEPLTPALMMEHLPAFTASRTVSSDHTPAGLEWHLRRASATAQKGPLRGIFLRGDDDSPLGWYLYHAATGETGQVLQVVGTAHTTGAVLEHLFTDAWQRGVVSLGGRADPPFLQIYSDHHCLFTRRGPGMMIRTTDAALALAFHRGDLFFSRLDGEWSARLN